MNTILSTLIIVAFAYLAFVTWIFRKRSVAKANPPTDSTTQQNDNARSIVPKSDFNVQEFQKAIGALQTVTTYLVAKFGDVDTEDVVFKETEEEATESASQAEETPDISEIDPEIPTPPATGNSLAEIEQALNVAVNGNAGDEAKVKAGTVLSGIGNAVFIGQLITDEKIGNDIMKCIAESMRKDKKRKPTKRGNPAPKEKPKPIDVATTIRDMDLVKRKKDEDED